MAGSGKKEKERERALVSAFLGDGENESVGGHVSSKVPVSDPPWPVLAPPEERSRSACLARTIGSWPEYSSDMVDWRIGKTLASKIGLVMV